MDSSCQSIRLEIDSFCQSAVDLNFEEGKPQANQLLVNVRVQMHSAGTRAGRRGGLEMQTSRGWRTIALYSAKSSHKRYSNSILFRFLQKKNSFFNKQELNFASELSYRFQDLFKEEMPMFKALVLNKNQIMPGEDSPKWLPIGTAFICNIWFSLGLRAFQLPRLYVSHVALH